MISEVVPVSVKGTNCLKGIVGKYKSGVSVQEWSLGLHFGKLTLGSTTYDR